MKNVILKISVAYSLVIFSACEKDTTENTVKPPIVNYPYDSIHKKLIGNWIWRSYYNTSVDTNYFLKISYDTILIKRYPNSRYAGSDTNYRIMFLNYKLRSNDTLEGLFSGYRRDTLINHRTAFSLFDSDSLILSYVMPHNNASLPLYYPLSAIRIK